MKILKKYLINILNHPEIITFQQILQIGALENMAANVQVQIISVMQGTLMK